MKTCLVAILCVLSVSCATVGGLDVQAERLTHDAIYQSEVLHQHGALNDDQFKQANVVLFRVATAGETFTRAAAGGNPNISDVTKFLAALDGALAELHTAFPTGKIAAVIADLDKAVNLLNDVLGKL